MITHFTPEEMETPAYHLFFDHFPIHLANRFIYTSGHFQRVIGLASGDMETDRMFMNDMTVVRRTPAQIITLYDMGASPIWVNNEDVAKVYQWLKAHLNQWAELIKDPLSGITKPPVGDLFMMESYLNEIGSHAVREIERSQNANYQANVGQSDSWLDQIAKDFGGDGLFSLFSDGEGDTGHQKVTPHLESTYHSKISDSFSRSPFAQRRY